MCGNAAQYFCLLRMPLPLVSVKLNSKLKYCICLFYKIALIHYIVAELDRVKADLSVSFSRYFRSGFFFPNLSPLFLLFWSLPPAVWECVFSRFVA